MRTLTAVIARNEAISELYRSGKRNFLHSLLKRLKKLAVMLSPACPEFIEGKHSGQGLSAGTLRQAQGDSALLSLFVVLFCLFVSINAFGQTPDTIHNNNTTKWVVHERTSVPDNPLIIVDDVTYDGDLNNINPNIIESIDIHKDESTLATYGSSAVNGVIIVKTKSYLKNDKARSIDSLVSNDALFVIDGEPSKNKLNGIDPNNILILNILKKGKGSDPSLAPINDIVIVVTRSAAIKSYQKKFSAVSKEYKKYLDDNNGGDSRITYFISNGEVLRTDDNKSIRILYEIPQDKIDKVSFSTHKNVEDIRMIMVGIDLKK